MPTDTDIRVALEEIRGDVKLVLEKVSNQDRRIADVESRVSRHDASLENVKATVLKWTGAGTLLSMIISSGFLYTIFHH